MVPVYGQQNEISAEPIDSEFQGVFLSANRGQGVHCGVILVSLMGVGYHSRLQLGAPARNEGLRRLLDHD